MLVDRVLAEQLDDLDGFHLADTVDARLRLSSHVSVHSSFMAIARVKSRVDFHAGSCACWARMVRGE